MSTLVPSKPRELADLLRSRPMGMLDSQEGEAFAQIGLTPDNWHYLIAVPLLASAVRASRSPLAWLRLPWGGIRSALDDYKLQLDRWLTGSGSKPGHNVEFRKLCDAVHPTGSQELDNRAFRIACSLLCWGLAKHFDPKASAWCLQVLWQCHKPPGKVRAPERVREEITELLRSLIDDFLQLRSFPSVEGLSDSRHGRQVLIPVPLRDPTAILVFPLAELFHQSNFRRDELSEFLRKLGYVPIQTPFGAIGRFLEPEWVQLLRAFLRCAEDIHWTAPSERYLKDCHEELVRHLAAIPYQQRRQLLLDLIQCARSIQSQLARMNAPSPLQIDSYFQSLQLEVALSRQAIIQPVAATHAKEPKAMNGSSQRSGEELARTGTEQDRASAVQPCQTTSDATSAPKLPLPIVIEKPWTTIPWDEILKGHTPSLVDEIENRLPSAQLLFAPEPGKRVTVVKDWSLAPESLWFVGDLHGDPLALENAWGYIEQQTPSGVKPHVLFLGDFVDRSPHSHKTLLSLFKLILDHPGQIGIVVGNHDLNFEWDKERRRFVSTIEPAEYTLELNDHIAASGEESEFVRVGMKAMELFGKCPRAVFLPDGLLIAHGGFPHTDRHESLTGVEALNDPECLQDFVWLRASANSRRKVPNRGSRGCDFGYEDFSGFCQRARCFDLSVCRLLRGHDHVPERYQTYPRYEAYPILTINSMCRRLDDELMSEQFPLPCVAKNVRGELPQVHRLRIDPVEVRKAFFANVASY